MPAQGSAAAGGAPQRADEGAPSAAASPIAAMRGVFVVGIARSGTSLLKALFDGHPELYVPPAESMAVKWCAAADPAAAFWRETRYGERFPEGSPGRARLEAALAARLSGPVDPARAVLAYMEAMAEVLPPAPGARVWVEKTPRHLRIVPVLLARLGPATRVLGLIRDPRGVLASQRKRWGRIETRAHARAFARRWAEADELSRIYEREHPQYLAVRYEDLASDPRPTMEKVAAHLGIAFTEGLVMPTRGGSRWSGNSSDGRAHAGISTRSVDKWAEEVPAELLDEVDRLLAPRMAARGYRVRAPEAARPSLRRALLGLATRRHVAASRARWETAAGG